MTLDHAGFQDWLDRYVAAWKSYDPDAIGDLFSEDAEYRYHPQDEPVRGRDAIVAGWLEDPDDPGTFDAHYEPLAIDGPTHVAIGWSRYFNAAGELSDGYSNVYVCRFDDAGRCSSFTEYWAQDRRFARAAAEGAATAVAADAGG
jgi:ketosteroid isomerase-like protein